MSFFLELTQSNKQPLDIPMFSVLFAEELNAETQKELGAKCGLFYDVGAGLQNALVTEPFGKIEKALVERKADFVRLRSVQDKPIMLMKSNIRAIRGLGDDHGNEAKSQIIHSVGQQVLPLDVLDTRAEIREKMDA